MTALAHLPSPAHPDHQAMTIETKTLSVSRDLGTATGFALEKTR